MNVSTAFEISEIKCNTHPTTDKKLYRSLIFQFKLELNIPDFSICWMSFIRHHSNIQSIHQPMRFVDYSYISCCQAVALFKSLVRSKKCVFYLVKFNKQDYRLLINLSGTQRDKINLIDNVLNKFLPEYFTQKYDNLYIDEMSQEATIDYTIYFKSSILDLFRSSVKNYGSSAAVEFEDQIITYMELNRLSNSVASCLISSSGIDGNTIGIFSERGISMILATLGILKSNFAFMPIATNLPRNYLKSILEGSGINLLLIQKKLLGKIKSVLSKEIKILFIEDLLESTSEYVKTNINESQPAYLIYTSGTTGKPKGVVVSHKALLNSVLGSSKVLDVSQDDTVLQAAPPSFDVAIAEWTTALCNGAKLCILPEDKIYIREELFNFINQHGITLAMLTSKVLESLPKRKDCSLKKLVYGGEHCGQQTVDFWAEHCCLYNAYGLTETAITIALTPCLPNKDPRIIENFIPNNNFLILSENLEEIKVGEIGELCVGGKNLADGYFKNKMLTDKKFISYPCGLDNRLLKTGDLAKKISKSRFILLGRKDSFVKIRGVSVDLTSIENLICKYKGIRQCVVVVNKESGSIETIVAYMVSDKGYVMIEELQRYLEEKLPSYMVPTDIFLVDNIPLTNNGKVDLARIHQNILEIPSNLVLGETDVEECIKRVWINLLVVEKIPKTKNLFELGANSLILAKAASALSTNLNRLITVVDLFEHPTIKALSDYFKASELTAKVHEG